MGLVQETGQLLSRLPTHRSVCRRDAGETVGPKKAACRDGRTVQIKNTAHQAAIRVDRHSVGSNRFPRDCAGVRQRHHRLGRESYRSGKWLGH